ncbi:MAG TPA: hypothetical protein VHG71_09960 [Verrucomicrobiae bacterium]|nr:hypothetical protein [Verrucomicrobiae bacterium]
MTDLPHRTLFQNEFVSLVLVGLKHGQELLLQHTPFVLLTVTHGCVQLLGTGHLITLREGGQRRLESDNHWQIHALSEADLLFFIPTIKAAIS